MRSCAQLAALAWVALVAFAPSSLALVPVLNKVTPDRGYSIGGFRITLEGRNLAFLADQVDVGVGKQACEDVRIEQPWKSLSCRMPECKGCTHQAIRVSIAGVLSNAVDFTYTGVCEGEQLLKNRPTVKLPAQYSRAENCTICRALVSSTIASTPDRVSYESLRLAMRDSCGSPSVRSYRVMDPICKKNIRDYFVPCAALMFGEQDQLLDAIWSQWEALYDLGGLVDYACRQVGRCGGSLGLGPND